MAQTGAFSWHLLQKIVNCLGNDFVDNHDNRRFREEPLARRVQMSWKHVVKRALKTRNFCHASSPEILSRLAAIERYVPGLERVYELLEDAESKGLLVDVMAYRVLGKTKVKLPLNDAEYWTKLADIEAIAENQGHVASRDDRFLLQRFRMRKLGFDLDLVATSGGILNTFVLRQYERTQGSNQVAVGEGDVVIDGGACWGDTSLYFADRAGPNGHVYSFEFIPTHLKVIEQNIAANARLRGRITPVAKPLWSSSGRKVYYVDRGPGSRVSMERPADFEGEVETVSIDEFAAGMGLPRVDFIKMDIEGAEQPALRGAEKTIRKWKPKLSVSVYHSLDDVVAIPAYLDSLGLGYRLWLGHFTIHSEETVLFAAVSRPEEATR